MRRRSLMVMTYSALAGACMSVDGAAAQDLNALNARFIFDAGWFFMSTDTRVRLDGKTTDQRGTDIDLDETFGLDDEDRFRVEGFWRFADRHALRLMYFENDRRSTKTIARDIRFGDETFPVGVSVTARADLKVGQLSYDYAFLRRPNYEVAAGIGVHMLDLGLDLKGTLQGPSGSVTRALDEDARTTAPLPVLGLRGTWSLPHNFYITAQAQYFHIEIDPYSGGLTDLKATLVWQATDHFGVGIGYNDFGFRFDLDDEGEFDGRLRWDYGGAFAFASFMF